MPFANGGFMTGRHIFYILMMSNDQQQTDNTQVNKLFRKKIPAVKRNGNGGDQGR